MSERKPKVGPSTPLVKPRRPFHLPPNRVHKDKKDRLAQPKHRIKDSEARHWL